MPDEIRDKVTLSEDRTTISREARVKANEDISEYVFRVAKLHDFYRAMKLESIEQFNMKDSSATSCASFGDGNTALEAIEDCCRNIRKEQ